MIEFQVILNSNLFILSKYARVMYMIAIDMSLKTDRCAVRSYLSVLDSIIWGQNDAFNTYDQLV